MELRAAVKLSIAEFWRQRAGGGIDWVPRSVNKASEPKPTQKRKSKRVKKRSFNIGVRQRGTKARGTHFCYDRGPPSQAVINYIEGIPEIVPIAKYPPLSKVAPTLLKEWKVDNVPDEDPPKLQDSLLDDEEDQLYCNIASIDLPIVCSIGSLARADVHPIDPIHPDDVTVPTRNEVYTIKDYENKTIFYDEARAQIDPGAKVAVTNLLSLLHDPFIYTKRSKCNVRMKGATSMRLITPTARGYLRVPANNVDGYMDVECYYSPEFTSTLLADNAVLKSTRHQREYSGVELKKFLAHNKDAIESDLDKFGTIDPDNINYRMDYGTCMLIASHRNQSSRNIYIPGVICSGLCFTQPLIYPNLEREHPDASPKTSSEVLKEVDSKFKQECKTKALEMLYQFQQDQHIQLMSQLESLPKDISENVAKLPLHNLMYTITPVSALKKEAEELLWHQRLIHGGDHSYDTIHKHVDGIPNMSGLEFDDVTKCSTCLRTKLTKVSPGHTSLRDKLKVPYQGLYVDFGFSGKVQCDKDGKVIEETQKEVEGINGETCWILISDGKTSMLHGDCRLTKASPINYLRSFLCEYSPNCPDKWVVLDKVENYIGIQMFVNYSKSLGITPFLLEVMLLIRTDLSSVHIEQLHNP